MILCKRCETLEKCGIPRKDVFYADGDFCKQCHRDKKQTILNEDILKTLDFIREKYGSRKVKSKISKNSK